MCVRVFTGVSAYICISIYIYIVFLNKSDMCYILIRGWQTLVS
jgi:hypothetical protein